MYTSSFSTFKHTGHCRVTTVDYTVMEGSLDTTCKVLAFWLGVAHHGWAAMGSTHRYRIVSDSIGYREISDNIGYIGYYPIVLRSGQVTKRQSAII